MSESLFMSSPDTWMFNAPRIFTLFAHLTSEPKLGPAPLSPRRGPRVSVADLMVFIDKPLPRSETWLAIKSIALCIRPSTSSGAAVLEKWVVWDWVLNTAICFVPGRVISVAQFNLIAVSPCWLWALLISWIKHSSFCWSNNSPAEVTTAFDGTKVYWTSPLLSNPPGILPILSLKPRVELRNCLGAPLKTPVQLSDAGRGWCVFMWLVIVSRDLHCFPHIEQAHGVPPKHVLSWWFFKLILLANRFRHIAHWCESDDGLVFLGMTYMSWIVGAPDVEMMWFCRGWCILRCWVISGGESVEKQHVLIGHIARWFSSLKSLTLIFVLEWALVFVLVWNWSSSLDLNRFLQLEHASGFGNFVFWWGVGIGACVRGFDWREDCCGCVDELLV